MDKFLEIILKKYNKKSNELFLKAKFVLITTVSIIFTLFIILIYTSYLGGMNSSVFITESIGFVTMLFALGMLIRGNYEVAIHTILIAGFSTIWIVMCLENVTILTRLDTIVFIIGLLAAMPLVLFKSRKPMVVYFLLNILMFLIYNYYLGIATDLTKIERLDYFLDNFVVMTFVFFVSFTLFAIYQQVLFSLKVELKDRKKAEISLKENERRFRELAELLPETIYEVDILGKLTFVNEKAFDLFGYTHQEFDEGIDILDLIHEDDRDRAIENIGKIAAGEEVGIKEYRAQKKDGTFFPGLFHSSPIINENQVVGFRGFLIDITEKKRTQEYLIQSEKMMSVGGLAAGMAHEINNPLAGIIQNANVLSNRLTKIDLPANLKAAESAKTNMETIKRYMDKRDVPLMLKAITESGARVATIVDNMLGFSKKGDLNFLTYDPVSLMEKTLELAATDFNLKKKYDFKNIILKKEYENGLQQIVCDESQMQQVFLNILNNGAHAMHEKSGHLKPEFVLRLKNEKYLNMLRIEIQDNGPGLDGDTQKRIFEPFFTTKAVGQGTGLGLSVSYFIVTEKHKGTIEVESELGKGTKFIIRLPMARENNKAPVHTGNCESFPEI